VSSCSARFSLNLSKALDSWMWRSCRPLVRIYKVSGSAHAMSKAHRAELIMITWGLQLKKLGNGWVIYCISGIGSLFIHGYSSSNALNKVPKAMDGLSQTSAPFKAGQTPSLKKKFRTRRGRRNRTQDTEGCSQDTWSPTIKGSESFIGSYDLNDEPLMHCHHWLTSNWSEPKMRMKVALSLAASPGW